ncbi:hypothetical protein MOUN0_A04522 [Monosporozyma unispora]|nr:hypothetical protein C6P44_004598 [Kazachstania unispora]
MPQVLRTRTPTGSPERSRSLRRESPLTIRYRNSRSPTKSPKRNPERRRSTLVGMSGAIPSLSRSNSLQRIHSMESFTTGSSPTNSNSGSPLKNLVDNMNNMERLSPLRRKHNYSPMRRSQSPTRSSPTPGSPIHAVSNNISFTFFEEEAGDRVSILNEYSGRNVLSAPIDHENRDPSGVDKMNNRQDKRTGFVFKELNSDLFKGSITDPKTNQTIYLDEK